MHVNQGVFQIFMSEQHLNGAEIGAGFIEVCRETMAQRMGVDAFLETGALGGFMTCVPNGFRIDGPVFAIVAGEQPGAGFAMVEPPVGARAVSSLGLSMTSRSLRPLPPRMCTTMR